MSPLGFEVEIIKRRRRWVAPTLQTYLRREAYNFGLKLTRWAHKIEGHRALKRRLSGGLNDRQSN